MSAAADRHPSPAPSIGTLRLASGSSVDPFGFRDVRSRRPSPITRILPSCGLPSQHERLSPCSRSVRGRLSRITLPMQVLVAPSSDARFFNGDLHRGIRLRNGPSYVPQCGRFANLLRRYLSFPMPFIPCIPFKERQRQRTHQKTWTCATIKRLFQPACR